MHLLQPQPVLLLDRTFEEDHSILSIPQQILTKSPPILQSLVSTLLMPLKSVDRPSCQEALAGVALCY